MEFVGGVVAGMFLGGAVVLVLMSVMSIMRFRD